MPELKPFFFSILSLLSIEWIEFLQIEPFAKLMIQITIGILTIYLLVLKIKQQKNENKRS